jgi:hypothetical protein
VQALSPAYLRFKRAIPALAGVSYGNVNGGFNFDEGICTFAFAQRVGRTGLQCAAPVVLPAVV